MHTRVFLNVNKTLDHSNQQWLLLDNTCNYITAGHQKSNPCSDCHKYSEFQNMSKYLPKQNSNFRLMIKNADLYKLA